MSGLEVVGIILGSIPLVISALEHYGGALQSLSRWRSTSRELQSLRRRLGTQQAIFTNTCEHLLSGIVPSTKLEAMIVEPFGPLWQDPNIKCKLQMRLDRVIEPFENTIKTMVEAVEHFKNRLDLDENGEVKWIEAKAIVRELKRASFTIRRSHYDYLLDTLSDGNQDLKTLTMQSLQLEPERNERYQGRLLILLRDISKSAYTAISNSFHQCSCSTIHHVSLEMATPELRSTNTNEQLLHNAVFRCAFSYRSVQQDAGADMRQWEKMLFKLDSPQKLMRSEQNQTGEHYRVHAFESQPQPNTARSRGARRSDRLRENFENVKFAMQSTFSGNAKVQSSSSTSSTTTTTTTTTETPLNNSASIMPSLETRCPATEVLTDMDWLPNQINLCQIIRKQGKSAYVPCYGYIGDQSADKHLRFGVHPSQQPHEDYESLKLFPMKHILEDQSGVFPRISYHQRMKLAVDISSSLLQLNGSPWLPEILTNDNIFFMTRDNIPIYDRAFVIKGSLYVVIPETPMATDTVVQSQSISSQSLFALGVLLVELLLLRGLNHVWEPRRYGTMATLTIADQVKDWKALKDILSQVEVMGGSNYYSAVRRLLFCEFTHAHNTFQNEEVLYQEIYGKAIALLVEDRSLSQI